MKRQLFELISTALQARENCIKNDSPSLGERWQENIDRFSKMLPSGSGFDYGCEILVDECTDKKLVFSADFHHMDEHGYYDGWTEHKVILTPSFRFGFNMRVTGKNKNDIKNYISDVFAGILYQTDELIF